MSGCEAAGNAKRGRSSDCGASEVILLRPSFAESGRSLSARAMAVIEIS